MVVAVKDEKKVTQTNYITVLRTVYCEYQYSTVINSAVLAGTVYVDMYCTLHLPVLEF